MPQEQEGSEDSCSNGLAVILTPMQYCEQYIYPMLSARLGDIFSLHVLQSDVVRYTIIIYLYTVACNRLHLVYVTITCIFYFCFIFAVFSEPAANLAHARHIPHCPSIKK